MDFCVRILTCLDSDHRVSTAVAHCWVAETEGVHPLFPGAPARIKRLAQQILERNSTTRNGCDTADSEGASSPWNDRKREEEGFLRTFSGGARGVHNLRPFVEVGNVT